MKILVLICLVTQFTFACHSIYSKTKFYELSNWRELESSLEKVIEATGVQSNKLSFQRSTRKELVEIYKSDKPLNNLKTLSSELGSKEFRYWKSLTKNKDESAVISVYVDNEKLVSFMLKTPEQDRYIDHYFEFTSLKEYEQSIARIQKNYSKENEVRGFRGLYEAPPALYAAQMVFESSPSFTKNILNFSKGERVLGLGRDNIKNSFVIFEGYSNGVVNISGIDYLEIRIDGEDIRFSLINVLSLKTAVY